jgi:hypothetical protein
MMRLFLKCTGWRLIIAAPEPLRHVDRFGKMGAFAVAIALLDRSELLTRQPCAVMTDQRREARYE